jgi:hypothetical protein
MIFILDGRGSTTVWNDGGQRVTFEWKVFQLATRPQWLLARIGNLSVLKPRD